MQPKDIDLLIALMKSKDISGRALATAAKWRSHTLLQRILRGEVKSIDPRRALLIANFLGVDLGVLFVTRVSTEPVRTVRQSRKKKVPA